VTALVRQLSPATLRLAELVWLAGRAALLGAHEIPGAVWWRLTEDVQPRGTVLLEVWGPDRVEAWRHLQENRPSDTIVVLRVLPANSYRRALRWIAARWWRLVLRPLRVRARGRA
jgi:hypothetical protein